MSEQSRQPEEAPNHASSMEKAEGSRENTNAGSGITNRPLEDERREQESLPPRGQSKDGSHA